MSPNLDAAIEVFWRAKEYVRSAGLWSEVEWQRDAAIEQFDESGFLREAAWVVLCSGFRESTVRRVFDNISLAYCDWESADAILETYPACKLAAMAAFANAAKNDAIVEIARMVSEKGFHQFKKGVLVDPVVELKKLPYIGEVTSLHLAKNLGLDVAKPDRHLVKISQKLGFDGTSSFCQVLSQLVGEREKVVDLIVWRYLADNSRLRAHWC